MFTGALSDLSFSLYQQKQAAQLRLDLQRAGYEMTTGQSANLVEALRGDTDQLFEIDRSLEILAQHSTGLSLAASRASATQLSLSTIQDSTGTLGVDLSAAIAIGDLTSANQWGSSANQMLETVVGALNTSVGGRYIFSGAAEDTAPLIASENIIADVTALIDAAPDTATALADIEAYFNDPGGPFETMVYGGATEDAPGVLTPDGNRIDYMLRADAQPLRDMMRGLATAAAFGSSALAGSTPDAMAIYESAGALIQSADQDITALRANLGMDEENISKTQSFVAAETAAFQLARTELAGVDAFDAAARFADIENQLSSAYTVTARISNLTLTNFLR